MDQREKNLYIELCSFKAPSYDKIGRLLEEGAATSAVLGLLFANRMAAVAFHVLREGGLLDKTDREFRNSLRGAFLVNGKQNEDFETCLLSVSKLLDACGEPYALLKGAYLYGLYPEGGRTANDIDVLVTSASVGAVSEALRAAGFAEGYLKNGTLVPATRRQIVESRMMRGETVPFVKQVDLPFMRYLEIDVNFSLDYKNGDDGTTGAMLARARRTAVGGTVVSTLDRYDFLLQLCFHLYKEATTMPWIRMKRDMTFYKYCDIYALLFDYTAADACALIARAEEYGAETELAYCLLSVRRFFGLRQSVLCKYSARGREALGLVIAPAEGKHYRYREPDPRKRFFKADRAALLEEVTP